MSNNPPFIIENSMKTFLDKMKSLKLEEIKERQKYVSEEELRDQIRSLPLGPCFKTALKRDPGESLSIIAEVKAKAPGRQNVDQLEPSIIVADYVKSGVQAISVLTDECDPDHLKPIDIEEIILIAAQAEKKLVKLFMKVMVDLE